MAHRQMSDANFNSGGIIFALSLHCPDQAAECISIQFLIMKISKWKRKKNLQ